MSFTEELKKAEVSIYDYYLTQDGGASQKTADLWCTYAGTRALTWLNESPLYRQEAANYVLECQNKDGGFAWQKGLRSDVWATYYCCQTLMDLGDEVPGLDQLGTWMESLQTSEGGFSMTPGQPADIWATYYAARVFYEVLQREPVNAGALRSWLIRTQQASGGLGWNTSESLPDVRACYYGAIALNCLESGGLKSEVWDHKALIGWLQNQQRPEGGFVFNSTQKEAGLWATFRAVKALEALGSKPKDPSQCIDWILSRKLSDSGFTRWSTYGVADVWSAFCATGALNALGVSLEGQAKIETVRFVQSCQFPETGFTYREPEYAGDSLATSALSILAAIDEDAESKTHNTQADRVDWLRRAHMPYEGGVMYMPGRGAEIRCTLWAVAALNVVGEDCLDRNRLYRWFEELQNPDGGFGYWHGRGSDVVATVSAIETLAYLGFSGDHRVNLEASGKFLEQCESESSMKFSPYGESSLSTMCQGIRGFYLIGMSEKAEKLAQNISQYATRLGGYSAQVGGIPDLISTYQAILTLQTLELDWDIKGLDRFIGKIRQLDNSYAWSPLSLTQSGPLAICFGKLLQHLLFARKSSAFFALPSLNL